MTKQKRPDPFVIALQQRIPYTITVSDGGDLASMRKAVKHGQTLTFSPVADPAALQVGDIVLVNWRGGAPITHLIGAIREDQFLIINSLGKENGWVTADAILGYVTQTIEPPERPAVPTMLDQLENTYHAILVRTDPSPEAAARLLSVAVDMRWYAIVIEPSQWNLLPRLNLWSFEQHLWHLTQEAQQRAQEDRPTALAAMINHGKEHVGQVAMIATLLAIAKNAILLTEGSNQTSITIRNVNVGSDLVPLVNLRNLCAGAGAQPVTIEQQRAKLREPNQHPATDHWVAEETGDTWTLLGQSFGHHTIPERYLARVEVHPDWRRRGLGRLLLQRVIERAKALGAEHLLCYAVGGEKHQAAHAFLQAQGFQAKSDAWFLRTPADVPVTTPQWPIGYSVRSFAEVQDLAILWQVCYGSYGDQWGHGENSLINRAKPPESTVIDWLSDEAPRGENIFLVFDEQGNVAGICRGFVGQPQGDTLPTGVIDAPGVVPAYRHLALQRPLMQTVMRWLRAQGQSPLELHAFGDSAATVALYRELGFTLQRHLIAYHLDLISRIAQ